jgi:hypothetical protein
VSYLVDHPALPLPSAPQLELRFDAATRPPALGDDLATALRSLAAELQQSIPAVSIEHVWTTPREDVVARTGGAQVANEFVEASGLTQVSADA